MSDEELKKTYGIKPAVPSHLLQILLIQLVVRTYRREHDREILSGDKLIFCLFDILKTIVDSGNGKDIWFEAKKEMENKTSCGFELRNIFQLKKIVHSLADRNRLKEMVNKLMSNNDVPLVNWPLVEGAIQIEIETRSAKGKEK